ncbi:MAG: thymidine phosphorylase [Lentisphaerae bacterium]|nr:thymidine phosphorylase [Lentisphaerota bacterium]
MLSPMLAQWIIEKKRDGKPLSDEEIRWMIQGFVKAQIPDYQMSALAMAILFRGMSADETASLTEAMRQSGDTIDTSDLPPPCVDKHSTGGIGDKISIILAPLAAACGLTVPMIAGRGLGITGGTLDKLESIPGYRTALPIAEFRDILRQCRCSIIGQTDRIAPADRRFYALRDVTGTVPSIPLIVASILSKKLSVRLNGLVMDVKWGTGAFMKTLPEAEGLANSLLETSRRMGCPMTAMITDMNQPLGRTAGNALEIIEAMDTFQGKGPADIVELTLAQCAHMLVLGRLAGDRKQGTEMARRQLESGAALSTFLNMVRLHGGDISTLEHPERLPAAMIHEPIPAPADGAIRSADAESLGKACVILGAGRQRMEDAVDHAVGLSDIRKIGERVSRGAPLAVLHANDAHLLAQARALVETAFALSPSPVTPPPLIARVIAKARAEG